VLTQPPVDVLHSLARLTGDTDFVRVLEWLDRERNDKVSEMLTQTKEILVFQGQGYALCMDDFIRAARSARVVLGANPGRQP